jgi:hypothetical protein
MLNRFVPFVLLLMLMVMFSCGLNPEQRIVGEWRLAAISADTPLPDYSEEDFRFTFSQSATYEYVGNLKFREAGTYRIEAPYLYTKDTLRTSTEEKAVLIDKLTRDSLILRMAGETIMRLYKVKGE